jgi:hypothetical protein
MVRKSYVDKGAGGGCPSNAGSAGSMQAQGGAWETQIVAVGFTMPGSSKAPARMKIRCGRDSAALNRGVPHRAQKRRCMILPLSATIEKSPVVPCTLTASLEKQEVTVPLPAPKYWQTRHQQIRVNSGAATLRNRTARHKHPPVISMQSLL